MKIVIFQGQSRYDVLRYVSRKYESGFRQLGHETHIFDMTILNSTDYLRVIKEFKPDFTLGLNPVCFYFDEKIHYEYTGIPHIVQLGDSGFYHIYNRALKNPNHPLVYTIFGESSFEHSMNYFEVQRYSNLIYGHAFSNEMINLNKYRPYPVVFFGTYTPSENIVEEIKKNFTGVIKTKIVEFCYLVKEWITINNVFLPNNIEFFFEQEFPELQSIEKDKRTVLLQKVYPFIDQYYRNLCREIVLTELSNNNTELFIFGKGFQQLLGEFRNVRLLPPVGYQECLDIVRQSKITLNITPNFTSCHERVFQSLMDGSICCTSVMPKLIDEIPDLLETTIFYDLNNLERTKDTINYLLSHDEERLLLAEQGHGIAKKYFSSKNYAAKIINIYKTKF